MSHADRHLILARMKSFMDDYITFRQHNSAWGSELQTPMFFTTARMASEGHLAVHTLHRIVRGKAVDKNEIIERVVENGFTCMQFGTNLCFFRWGNKCAFGPDFYMEYSQASKSFELVGTLEDARKAKAMIDSYWPSTHLNIDLGSSVSQNGLVVSSRVVDTASRTHSSFYPFLGQPMEKFFDEYLASKACILLLIGPPGTGKTSFLRDLVIHTKVKAMLAYSKEVIESPYLYQQLSDSNYDLLALEDADNFVESRENGNPFMASLLNDTQGVANASNKKIVISTNLSSLNSVDTALTREGRCFKVVEFRHLTHEEASAVWKAQGMPQHKFPDGEKYLPLSTILNMKDKPAGKKRGMGFVQSPDLMAA